MEHKEINEQVFDWIEERSFSELTTTEKEVVLQCMTANEYDEIYSANNQLRQFQKDEKADRQAKTKVALLNKIEKENYKSKTPIFLWQTNIWTRAASWIILVALGWLLNWIISGPTKNEVITQLQIDTIYLDRTPKPQMVFADSTPQKPEYPSNAAFGLKRKTYISGVQSKKIEMDDLELLTLDKINETKNQSKGNSLRDDTLLNSFQVVSL